MIGLHRDPRGKTLFKGHAIKSSSTNSLSQGNSLRSHYLDQIENLRRRVRELESRTNQPHSSTESSRERDFPVESTNPCFMRQERIKRDYDHDISEGESFPGKEPAIDDVVSERAPPRDVQCCAEGCIEQGAETSGASTKIELSIDN